jgi:5'-nucleotidase
MANPSGSRIESIKIRCEDCEIPNYVDLENEKDYCVIFPDFLARTGGDGFSMFPDEILNSTVLGLDTGEKSFI